MILPKLRHIAWSHFESDECGALNDWLQLAPQAQPVCTLVGKLVTPDDFSIRPARGTTEDVLGTGKYRYRFYRSPYIPHGWDAGVLFEETGDAGRHALSYLGRGDRLLIDLAGVIKENFDQT